jgi:hypothetical protein
MDRSEEPPTIEHVASADAGAKLDRLRGSGLIERGSVVLIGLDMIKAELGDRWRRRSEQVIEQTERRIKARLSDADIFARISETGYILCFAEHVGIAAHAIAVRILEEIVLHFLGSCATRNLVVQTVRSVNGAAISAEPLDLARLAQLRRQAASQNEPQADDAAPEAVDSEPASAEPPPADQEASPSPLVSRRGAFRLEWGAEPVLHVKRRAPAAIRIRPRLSDVRTGALIHWSSLATWPTSELVELECGFIGCAIDLGANQKPSERRGIIMPLSIQTLSSARGRMEILRRLADVPAGVQGRLVIEICGVSTGTPVGHLHEAISSLRTRARAVIVRPRLTKSAVALLRHAQIDGVSAGARDLGRDPRDVAMNMAAFAAAVKAVAPMTLVTGITSKSLTDSAERAGVTHVGVRGDMAWQAAQAHEALAAC